MANNLRASQSARAKSDINISDAPRRCSIQVLSGIIIFIFVLVVAVVIPSIYHYPFVVIKAFHIGKMVSEQYREGSPNLAQNPQSANLYENTRLIISLTDVSNSNTYRSA